MEDLHIFDWKFRLRRNGLVIAESDWTPNVATREGIKLLLDVFFRGTPASTPVRFEMGLCNSIPDVSTTGASLAGEMSGFGYQRNRLTRDTVGFPALSTDPLNPATTPYSIWTAPQTFSAVGGAIGPFESAFLVAMVQLGSDPSVLTQFLISAAATSPVTTIANGDQSDATIRYTVGK